MIWKPIVKKYSDGKVKRTLKKGLKGLEMVKRERNRMILIDEYFKYSFHSKFKNPKKVFKLLFELTYYHYRIS